MSSAAPTPATGVSTAPISAVAGSARSVADWFLTPLILAAALAWFGLTVQHLGHATAPQAFHDLTYARSITLGHGLTLMGVETGAFNNPAWVYMVAGVGYFTGELVEVSHYIGLFLALLTLCLMPLWSYDFFGIAWPGALGALLIAGQGNVVAWMDSGTDVPLQSLLLLLGAWTLSRDARSGWPWMSGLSWTLIGLTRPECLVLSAGVWLVMVIRAIVSPRQRWWLCVGALGTGLILAATLHLHWDVTWPRGWGSFGRLVAPWDAQAAWPAVLETIQQHPEIAVLFLISAAVALERGPNLLHGTFLALHSVTLWYIALCCLAPGWQGPLDRSIAPITPVLAWTLGTGFAIALCDQPVGARAKVLYTLLLLGAVALLAASTWNGRHSVRRQVGQYFLAPASELRMQAQDLVANFPAEANVASCQAAQLSYFLERPVLDLRGRHLPPGERRAWAAGLTGALAMLQSNDAPSHVHLPLRWDGRDAPVIFEWPEAAPLYYSGEFQSLYRRAGIGEATWFERRQQPLTDPVADLFFRAAFQVELPSVVRLTSPVPLRFALYNKSSATFLSVSSPVSAGEVRVTVTWLPAEGTCVVDRESLPLPVDVGPGKMVTWNATVSPPAEPGNYRVAVRLEVTGVGDFESLSGLGLQELPVTVMPAWSASVASSARLRQRAASTGVDTSIFDEPSAPGVAVPNSALSPTVP